MLTPQSVVLLATLPYLASSCLSLPHYSGLLSSALVIATPGQPLAASSCHCCALCHHQPLCRSLTYSTETGACTLYSRVGGFTDVSDFGNTSVQFFFLPGWSGSGEFCRRDSDCQVAGELCLAYVCTSSRTITCSSIHRLNPQLPSAFYWVSFGGDMFFTHCSMSRHGSTQLARITKHDTWLPEDVLYRAPNAPYLKGSFSILRYANLIRDSGTDTYYQVTIIGVNSQAQSRHYNGIMFNVTRDYSMTSHSPRRAPWQPIAGGFRLKPDEDRIVFPYISNATRVLYTMNGGRRLADVGTIILRRGEANFSQEIEHPDVVYVEIRE